MCDIKPYCPYNFNIPKSHQKRLTHLSRYGMEKLTSQFSKCSDLSQSEFNKLIETSSHSVIICDENFDLIGFLIAKREENNKFIVRYFCGDVKYTEEFIDFIKSICGYNHGSYDGSIEIFYFDDNKTSSFKNHKFVIDNTFKCDEYRNTTKVLFKYKGLYTYRKIFKLSLDKIKNNYSDK